VTVAGAFVLGVCFDVFGVLWMTTMQREIPPESLSRGSSYDALGSLMFGPIGLMLADPAAARLGAGNALLACGALVLVATCAALLSPDVRNLRAPARRAPASASGVGPRSASRPRPHSCPPRRCAPAPGRPRPPRAPRRRARPGRW